MFFVTPIVSLAMPLLKRIALPALIVAVSLWGLHQMRENAYQRGWGEREAIALEERHAAQMAAADELLKNTRDAAERENQALQTVVAIDQHAKRLEARLRQALNQKKETSHDPRDAGGDVARAIPDAATGADPAAAVVLDGGGAVPVSVVGVLNAARAGAHAGGPEAGSADALIDAEGRAAAQDQARFGPVTLSDLALNDLEVVRQYHQLAARHAGLVDWVNQQCLRNQPTQ